MRSLSLVIPAHNEEQLIASVVADSKTALCSCTENFEIIVVNDGSSDNTASVLESLDNIRIVTHASNQGYGAALRSGFEAATKDYVCFIDGDGQIAPSDICNLSKFAGENIVVLGVRENRNDSLFRNLLGKVYTKIFSPFCFGISVSDMNAALKIFPKKLLGEIELTSDGALINAELLSNANKLGYKFIEKPIKHLPRLAGESSGGSLKVILKALIETNKIRRSTKN